MVGVPSRSLVGLFESRDDDARVDLHRLEVEPVQSCFVKVGHANERFWCKVRSEDRSDGTLVVVVDNHLVRSHGFDRGDELTIASDHVLEIAGAADLHEFELLSVAAGSQTTGALAWQHERLVRGVAVPPRWNHELLINSQVVVQATKCEH